MNSTVLALQIALDLQQFDSPRQVRIASDGRLYYKKIRWDADHKNMNGVLGVYDRDTPINNIQEDIEVTL